MSKSILDTRGTGYCLNICIWHDGTVRPRKGCDGHCKWRYDGQVFIHTNRPAERDAQGLLVLNHKWLNKTVKGIFGGGK